MTSITIERYKHEELVNTISHFPGIFLSIYAFYLLMLKFPKAEFSHIVSYIIYCISFFMIYLASTLYHGTKSSDKKQFLKKVDHACIYIFMGGCYTPFVMINMQQEYKFWYLGLIWSIVVFGVIYKFLSQYKNSILSLSLYLAFGFLCLLAKESLLNHIPSEAFKFLALGGAAYTIGAVFYAAKKIPYHHGIWHIFVLLGSISQMWAINLTY